MSHLRTALEQRPRQAGRRNGEDKLCFVFPEPCVAQVTGCCCSRRPNELDSCICAHVQCVVFCAGAALLAHLSLSRFETANVMCDRTDKPIDNSLHGPIRIACGLARPRIQDVPFFDNLVTIGSEKAERSTLTTCICIRNDNSLKAPSIAKGQAL